MTASQGQDPEATSVAKGLVAENRNESAIVDLQRRKLEARQRLVAARAEMRQLDAQMIEKGANGLDLVLLCW